MIEETFSVEETPSLDIRVASGKVSVRKGAAGTVTVRAKGNTDNLMVEQRGSTIWISNEQRRSWMDKSVHLTVEVPDGTDLDASVASADVVCEVPMGRLTINSASGDIRFTDADEIVVKTASGDVSGNNVAGRVNFTSASGDLQLDVVDDRAELSTASGNMRVGTASGAIITSTMSGDVRIDTYLGSDLSAKGMSGRVDLGVPGGTTVHLDATTMSGTIDLPEPSTTHDTPDLGTLNLRVRLVSGDLKLRRVV